jgi:recombination protein RecA
LCELSASRSGAAVTLAVRLVHDAQRRGETVAWIGGRSSSFFAPDVADHGVDLEALAVIRTRELPQSSEVARAADLLARSGAFGLIVLDLGRSGDVPIALQSRLLAAAQKHGLAILCLTEKTERTISLGSLVSLRGETELSRAGNGSFACALHVEKDKRRAPGWREVEMCRGPAGLH